MSLIRSILKHALFHPRRIAIVDDQRSFTSFSVAAGAYFVAREVRRHTQRPHVGVLLPTGGGFAVSLLGVWLAGRVAVPLNYLLSKEDLAHVIADAGLDLIITADKMLEFLGHKEGGDQRVIPEGVKLLKLEGVSFTGVPPMRWPPDPSDDELAVVLYTSGTSGKPKGVMLTHGNLDANARGAASHSAITPDQTMLGVLPQFHSFGLTALTLLPLTIGCKVIYTARFVPRRVVDLIREHRPQVMMAVPSMYAALLSVKKAGKDDFASLRVAVSGGEPLPEETARQYRDRFGVGLLEGYGLTETSPITHWSTPERNKAGSVGLPLPGVRQFIVDDAGKVLPPGEEGEIMLAGPNLMKGYLNQPELTAEVFTTIDAQGERVKVFRTGDIGRIDAEGYLSITGRKKEMLIIGGENVFPREIEEVLNTHPAVRASAVVGVADAMRGEVPIAFVEVEEGVAFDESEARAFLRGKLAPFKVPREVRVIEELPKSPTGKILRRALPV